MSLDNIKQFTKNKKDLETLIQSLRIYIQDLGMGFGREKCIMLKLRSEKRQRTEGIELSKILMTMHKALYPYDDRL